MSNRLTFSLASLIFLIALGLIFVPTSVLAHPDASSATDTPREHSHPLTESLLAQTDTDGETPGTAVTAHYSHPTVSSVVLKEVEGVTSGNMAVITEDDTATDDVSEHGLTLIVTFSEKVNTANGTEPTITADAVLDIATDFTLRVRNAAGVTVTNGADTSGTVTRSGKTGMAFEVPITFVTAAIPTGTDDMESLTFYVQVNAEVAYGLAQPAGVLDDTPGGANLVSTQYDFKLVKTLPTTPDTTPPTVVVKAPDMPDSDDKLPFMITFSESLETKGFGAFSEDDITITGGTAMFDSTGAAKKDTDFTGPVAGDDGEQVYTLKVMPGDGGSVTVTVGSQIQDTSGIALDTEGSTLSATYDRTAPTVMITAPEGPETDGNLTFTFVFSESIDPDSFDSNDIRGNGFSIVASIPMKQPSTDTTTMTETWTVKVTPVTPNTAVTVALNAGAVTDMNNNPLAAGMTATYTPPTPMAPGAPTSVMATALTGDDAGKITISWTAPTEMGTPPLTGYFVTKHYTDANGAAVMKRFPETGTIPKTATSYTIPPAGSTDMKVPPGTYTFTVTAMNTAGSTASVMSDPVTIEGPTDNPPMFATDRAVRTFVAGTDVSVILPKATDTEDDAAGKALTYSIDSNTPLPAGLSFTPSSRLVSGMPTTAGSSDVTYMVTDSADQTGSMIISFTVTPGTVTPVDPPADNPPMFATDRTERTVVAGTNVRLTLPKATDTEDDAAGRALTYSIDSNTPLPAGLSFTSSSRQVSGIPTTAGSSDVTYMVTDSARQTGSMVISFIVTPGTVTPVDPTNRPPVFGADAEIERLSATVGTFFERTLPPATDADGDRIMYSILPALPAGLSLDSASRYLSGTPRATQGLTTYTYYARNQGGTDQLKFTLEVVAAQRPTPTITPPEAHASVEIPLSRAGTLGPNQFVVLARSRSGAGILGGSVVEMGLVNLSDFFTNQGTISLHGPAGNIYNDVVISEIMWGLDDSLSVREHSQWIELYNTTKHSISLNGFVLKFHGNRREDNVWWNDPMPAIDVVGNAGAAERGVPATLKVPATLFAANRVDGALPWAVHGQSGQSTPGAPGVGAVDIVSMSRKINYNRVENFADDKRDERFKGDIGYHRGLPFGYIGDRWAASTHRNAWIASGRIATPGTQPQAPSDRPSKTVPRQQVIINEIGNSTTSAYDWIELYNTNTSGEINLKNWRLTYVYNDGGNGKEVTVLTFPGNDNIKIPAQTYLVIASSNPENAGNDLAAGINITKGKLDQTTRGLGERGSKVANYAVVSMNIPDDARRALFILRRTNDNAKLGTVHDIEDTVGTAFIALHGQHPSGWTGYNANKRVFYSTELWPLQGIAKGHGNVIDGGDEDFRAGKVYRRNSKNSGIGDKHAAVHGFTGVGYDRHAVKNFENGGTPGYNNGAVKGDKSDWMGQVTFSEIMLETEEGEGAARVPRATRLPQWIEIYNNSMTEGVNLNQWYLEIQNADSDDLGTRNLHGTLRLPSVIIPPNQTVLIVSNSGLNSGNFPEPRTINLFTNGTYRSILNLSSRGDSVLSKVGFYLELRDHKNNFVDEIGNLGVSRRTVRDNFDNEWEMPSLHSQDGHRTSLIRIYDDGVGARSGLWPVGGTVDKGDAGWFRASDTNFRSVPSLTYFGNHRDFGTPGYRGGGPLPVRLSKFRPERLDDGSIVIRWITESELDNAGFNILRSETKDGEFTKINEQLIAGNGTTSERNTYEYPDKTAKPNVVYYYQIQDVSLDGQVQTLQISRLKGNVSATGKATTTWGELKSLQ